MMRMLSKRDQILEHLKVIADNDFNSKIFKKCPNNMIKSVSEGTTNILTGEIVPPKNVREKLMSFRHYIKKLSNKKIPLYEKRRILIDHGEQFLQHLIPAAFACSFYNPESLSEESDSSSDDPEPFSSGSDSYSDDASDKYPNEFSQNKRKCVKEDTSPIKRHSSIGRSETYKCQQQERKLAEASNELIKSMERNSSPNMKSFIKTPIENAFEERNYTNSNEDTSNTHIDQRRSPYIGPPTDKTLLSTELMRDSYLCSLCPATFTHQRSMIRHHKSKHEKINHTCSYCQKIFTRKETLNEHMKNSHN